MDVFRAYLAADTLGAQLLQAHAYSNVGSKEYERHALNLALKAASDLEALLPAVRARLADLDAPAVEVTDEDVDDDAQAEREEAEDRRRMVNVGGHRGGGSAS